MSQEKYKLAQGTRVAIRPHTLNYEGMVGYVVGVGSTEMPVIGHMYLVHITSGQIPNEEYPYNTISVAEAWLSVSSSEESNDKY